MRQLTRLIYISRSIGSAAQLALKIREVAQKRNAEVGVTGILVASRHVFIQALEGPCRSVNDLYLRIVQDPRHTQPTLLSFDHVQFRLWPRWAMGLSADEALSRRASEFGLDLDAVFELGDSGQRACEFIYTLAGDK
jgi:hypothetical protein